MKENLLLKIVNIVLLMVVVGFGVYFLRTKNNTTVIRETQTQNTNQKNQASPYERREIKNTIIKNAKDIQSCYKEYLTTKPTATEGSVKMDWQINEDGKVKNAGVIQSSFNNEELDKCLIAKVGAIEFPPPSEGQVYTSHDFFFKTEETIKKMKENPAPLLELKTTKSNKKQNK